MCLVPSVKSSACRLGRIKQSSKDGVAALVLYETLENLLVLSVATASFGCLEVSELENIRVDHSRERLIR